MRYTLIYRYIKCQSAWGPYLAGALRLTIALQLLVDRATIWLGKSIHVVHWGSCSSCWFWFLCHATLINQIRMSLYFYKFILCCLFFFPMFLTRFMRVHIIVIMSVNLKFCGGNAACASADLAGSWSDWGKNCIYWCTNSKDIWIAAK